MIPELGHFTLILALLFAATQAIVPTLSRRAAIGQAALTVAAFACLMLAHLTSDFSVRNVVENSHTLKPLLYKISGVWGNHEGSMLLWITLLSLYGAAMAITKLPITALCTHGALSAGFTAFLLLASNPFARLDPAPVDGRDLNPLLQDPALAMHPPLLYLGMTGFAPVFCLAVAALLNGNADRTFAKTIKPWILFAWTALSAGIALGCWWAYYELGWGGWWFWDPVENASLMPWLLGTALLHSTIVLEKRNALPRWTILLALLTFSLAMLGTFLVRSGVLTSVHAFALDAHRGIFLLILLTLYVGGALALYAWRAPTLTSDAIFAPISRESALILNNLFLTIAAATVLTGTLYPLILSALNAGAIAVGPPYYTATIVPLGAPLLLLMGIGPFLPWKTADWRAIGQRLQIAALTTLAILFALLLIKKCLPSLAWLGFGLAAWLITSTLSHANRQRRTHTKLTLEHWSLILAHAGLGLSLLGMIGTTLLTRDTLTLMKPNDTIRTGHYTLTLKSITPTFGENYSALRATFAVSSNGGPPTFTLTPEKRHYPVAQKETSQTAIHTSWRDDLYVTLGDRDADTGGWTVRAYVHPLVPCLWLGFALIVFGGATGFIAERKRNHE